VLFRSRESFDKFVKPFKKNPTSLDRTLLLEASILASDIHNVVVDCLGVEVPTFLVDKFVKLAVDLCRERRITWFNFSTVIPKVIDAYNRNINCISDIPTLVKLMSKPRLVDKNMGTLGDMSTVYRDTMNLESTQTNILTDNSTTCRSRPSSPMKRHDPTSTIINAGTPKVTMQIPGYRGHIPLNTRNIVKMTHSYGEHPHPVQNDLVLTTKLSVLGYTGHFPSAGVAGSERTTGCDPKSTCGAGYGSERRIL